MADKLSIYNRAALHIGVDRLLTLTDDVETRRVFDGAWPELVEGSMLDGDWNFAKATVSLAKSTTAPTRPGFSQAYDYPQNYLRTIAVAVDPYFQSPFDAYVDEGGFLYSDFEPVYLRYIRNDLVGDTEIDKWPTKFAHYVGALLAFETVERITQGQTSKRDLFNLAVRALRDAKSVDARQEQGKRIATGAWLRARRGGMTGLQRQNNTFTLGGRIVTQPGTV